MKFNKSIAPNLESLKKKVGLVLSSGFVGIVKDVSPSQKVNFVRVDVYVYQYLTKDKKLVELPEPFDMSCFLNLEDKPHIPMETEQVLLSNIPFIMGNYFTLTEV